MNRKFSPEMFCRVRLQNRLGGNIWYEWMLLFYVVILFLQVTFRSLLIVR